MSESAHGQGFNPADGEGDEVADVPTQDGETQDVGSEQGSDSGDARTNRLLPDMADNDEDESAGENSPY